MARLLDRPLGVALLFAPLALLIWACRLRLGGMSEATAGQGLQWAQLLMLICGGGLWLYAARGEARARRPALALAAGAAALAAQLIAAGAAPNAALSAASAAASFVNMVIFAALAEELWFRGLWMRAARGSALIAVGGGALLFGLLHWPLGLGRAATTAALGALYGAARWRGAPLWALALAHGAVNWISGTALPATAWRLDPLLSQALFCAVALAAAAALFFFAAAPREETS